MRKRYCSPSTMKSPTLVLCCVLAYCVVDKSSRVASVAAAFCPSSMDTVFVAAAAKKTSTSLEMTKQPDNLDRKKRMLAGAVLATSLLLSPPPGAAVPQVPASDRQLQPLVERVTAQQRQAAFSSSSVHTSGIEIVPSGGGGFGGLGFSPFGIGPFGGFGTFHCNSLL